MTTKELARFNTVACCLLSPGFGLLGVASTALDVLRGPFFPFTIAIVAEFVLCIVYGMLAQRMIRILDKLQLGSVDGV